MFVSKNPKRMSFYLYLSAKDCIAQVFKLLGMVILGLGGVIALIGQSISDVNRNCEVEQVNYDNFDYYNKETLLGIKHDMYENLID